MAPKLPIDMECPRCGAKNGAYKDSFGTTVKRTLKTGVCGGVGAVVGSVLGFGPWGLAVGFVTGAAIGRKRDRWDKQYWECAECEYFVFDKGRES